MSGDAAKGAKTFKKKCSQCHTYAAVSLTATPALQDGTLQDLRVVKCFLLEGPMPSPLVVHCQSCAPPPRC